MPKPNRIIQRKARALAKKANISYQAALNQLLAADQPITVATLHTLNNALSFHESLIRDSVYHQVQAQMSLVDFFATEFDIVFSQTLAADQTKHMGLCPFCQDQRNDCIIDTDVRGTQYFSCEHCNAFGTVLDAAMRRWQCSKVEAVQRMAIENNLVVDVPQFADFKQSQDKKAVDAKDKPTIPLGFSSIDKNLLNQGVRRGEMARLLGKSGCGKTMLAVQMAANWAKEGFNTTIVSLEQNKQGIYARLVSFLLDVSLQEAQRHLEENSAEMQAIAHILQRVVVVDGLFPSVQDSAVETEETDIVCFNEINRAPQSVIAALMEPSDRPSPVDITPKMVGALVEGASVLRFDGKDCDIVIIDHLLMMTVDGDAPAEVKTSEILATQHLLHSLKQMAEETNTFAVVLEQLPRTCLAGIEPSWAVLNALYPPTSSGQPALLAVADYALTIWRPEQQSTLTESQRAIVKGQYKLALSASKHGAPVVEHLWFDANTTTITPDHTYLASLPSLVSHRLNHRGFDVQTIEHFQLGGQHLTLQKPDRTWRTVPDLTVPIFDQQQTLIATIKRRFADDNECHSCFGDNVEPANNGLLQCNNCKTTFDPNQSRANYIPQLGFDSTAMLYNGHGAKQELDENTPKDLFVVEGASDVWAGWQAGHKAIVAYQGVALSAQQAQEIVDLATGPDGQRCTVVLAGDDDKAGKSYFFRNVCRLKNIAPDLDIEMLLHIGMVSKDERQPCKDLADVLCYHGAEVLHTLMNENRFPVSPGEFPQQK